MAGQIVISVTDKTGLDRFKVLTDEGWKIVSTGGTSTKLGSLGIPHEQVSEVTGFPEMMDGRVKMLHPRIFGGVLADRAKQKHLDEAHQHIIKLTDLVVVNFYDFAGNPDIEQMDVGGPSLVCAAVKNGAWVSAVVDPGDYHWVIQEMLRNGGLSEHNRELLAIKALENVRKFYGDVLDWMHVESVAGRHFLNPKGNPNH